MMALKPARSCPYLLGAGVLGVFCCVCVADQVVLCFEAGSCYVALDAPGIPLAMNSEIHLDKDDIKDVPPCPATNFLKLKLKHYNIKCFAYCHGEHS